MSTRFQDLTGRQFTNLTVLERVFLDDGRKGTFWLCRCKCGKEKSVTQRFLCSGETKSCGDYFCKDFKDKKGKLHKSDIRGERFGKLLVTELHEIKNSRSYWKCKCDCGGENIYDRHGLVSGRINSCGCLYSERFNKNRAAKEKDLTGQKIGLFKVLSRDYNTKIVKGKSVPSWRCLCECGNEVFLTTGGLSATEGCSKCIGKRRSGENGSNWNHNISTEEREINKTRRLQPGYQQWINSVYKRDNYICQVTGKRGLIHAHHLEAWNSNKELRYDIDNGITLLFSVHSEFHKKYGKGNNTREQFKEFIKNLTQEEKDAFQTIKAKNENQK